MPGPDPSAHTIIDPTLAYFSERFASLGIDWCICGAVAANAYRSPRDTTEESFLSNEDFSCCGATFIATCGKSQCLLPTQECCSKSTANFIVRLSEPHSVRKIIDLLA